MNFVFKMMNSLLELMGFLFKMSHLQGGSGQGEWIISESYAAQTVIAASNLPRCGFYCLLYTLFSDCFLED